MIVEPGHISLRGPANRQGGASDYLCLRDNYLELLKREKQNKVDSQKTDRHLSKDHRTSEIPIETDVFPTGNGIFNMDGVAYAGQCLAEWIVFLTNRGSYVSPRRAVDSVPRAVSSKCTGPSGVMLAQWLATTKSSPSGAEKRGYSRASGNFSHGSRYKWPSCISRSRSAATAGLSPKSLGQSSSDRFEVKIVDARSYRRMRISSKSSAALAGSLRMPRSSMMSGGLSL
jgi:hypothetical protein